MLNFKRTVAYFLAFFFLDNLLFAADSTKPAPAAPTTAPAMATVTSSSSSTNSNASSSSAAATAAVQVNPSYPLQLAQVPQEQLLQQLARLSLSASGTPNSSSAAPVHQHGAVVFQQQQFCAPYPYTSPQYMQTPPPGTFFVVGPQPQHQQYPHGSSRGSNQCSGCTALAKRVHTLEQNQQALFSFIFELNKKIEGASQTVEYATKRLNMTEANATLAHKKADAAHKKIDGLNYGTVGPMITALGQFGAAIAPIAAAQAAAEASAQRNPASTANQQQRASAQSSSHAASPAVSPARTVPNTTASAPTAGGSSVTTIVTTSSPAAPAKTQS